MAKAKKPGQPTKYKPEFCILLIEHMAKGYSYNSFAAIAKVHRSIMYDWEKLFPEWLEAKENGFNECLIFWEKLAIDNILNKSESFGKGEGGSSTSLNSTLWIFNMKNRFNWRDKSPGEDDKTVTLKGEVKVNKKVDLLGRIKQIKGEK